MFHLVIIRRDICVQFMNFFDLILCIKLDYVANFLFNADLWAVCCRLIKRIQ